MSELTEFRKAKDEFFAKDNSSPLTRYQRRKFLGLEYYSENSKLKFVLRLEEFPEAEKNTTVIATSTGDSQPHIRWGRFTFSVDGQSVSLTVYQSADPDELFLPFADSTSGGDSYGEGRYLDLVLQGDGRHLVDFNYAYNPYCAYNPSWSCPIPPAENRLLVAIRTGEMRFPGAEGVKH